MCTARHILYSVEMGRQRLWTVDHFPSLGHQLWSPHVPPQVPEARAICLTNVHSASVLLPCEERISMGKGSYFGLNWVDFLFEGNCFFLWADHAHNLQVVRELQPGDALEALLQVRLHAEGVLGLRQDLQQLIIWQEEEPVSKQRSTATESLLRTCFPNKVLLSTGRWCQQTAVLGSSSRTLPHHVPLGHGGRDELDSEQKKWWGRYIRV